MEWTPKELEYIKNEQLSLEELCSLMPSRTRNSISIKRRRVLRKRQNQRWRREERDILKQYYGVISIEELQEMLPNRSEGSIRGQVAYLKKCGWSFQKSS